MGSFKETCLTLFETDDLYAALEIDRNATEDQIKRGYYKLSLKIHPDRVPENEKQEATEKFQALGKIHSILSDKEKRAIYDETGDIDDESSLDEDKDWYAYWRQLYPSLTISSIKEFEKNYKGSSEELNDLKLAYKEHKGDMSLILSSVMCATLDDEERFRGLLNEHVEEGELPSYPKFVNESNKKKQKRRNKFQKEAKEAEIELQKIGMGNSEDSLKSLIQTRQADRGKQMDDLFKHLEEKYCTNKPKGRKRKADLQASTNGSTSRSKKARTSSKSRKKGK